MWREDQIRRELRRIIETALELLLIDYEFKRAPIRPIMQIDHTHTRDRIVSVYDRTGKEVGWECFPVAPSADPSWQIYDVSRDCRTGWRRIRLQNV
jgi:hypothetical protein